MFENSIIWSVETYKVLSTKEGGDIQPLNQKKMKKKWLCTFFKWYFLFTHLSYPIERILIVNWLIQTILYTIICWSWELPVGSCIEFLQKDSISVTDVSQIHETSVNVPYVTNFLIPEELVVVLLLLCVDRVVLSRGVLFLRFVLDDLLSWGLEVVSFLLYLFVYLMVPKVIKNLQ